MFTLRISHDTINSPVDFDVQVTVHRDKNLTIKPTRCANSSFIFGIKLCMFRTVPLSIIRRFSLYIQQCYTSYWFRPDPVRKLSANLYDTYQCCMYSENLLMMDRGTVRNMQSFIPKIYLVNLTFI